jgi:two-component system, LytTR family, sensor kinase
MGRRSLFAGVGAEGITIYALIWLMIAVIHALVLYFGYSLNLGIALTEAALLNGWFAVLGIGIWFMLQFSDLQKTTVIELLITHLSAVTLLILLWLIPTIPLLKLLFSSDEVYSGFLVGSTAIRVVNGVILYAAIVSIVYLKRNMNQLRVQQARESALQHLLRDAELSMLRFQVNPHFLFNSLNSVSALIISNPDQANRMVLKLSDFMRYSLDSSGKALRSLNDELDHCRQYLDIEMVRYGERLKANFEVDKALLTFPVPAMLIQPLIENSVKHGLNSQLEGVTVDINVWKENDMLLIRVKNPTDSATKSDTQGTGTGLKNIQARLENLYDRRDLFFRIQTPEVFMVTLKIPLHA